LQVGLVREYNYTINLAIANRTRPTSYKIQKRNTFSERVLFSDVVSRNYY